MIDMDVYCNVQIPKWRYDEIESKAVELYKKLCITTFPVDMYNVMNVLGIRVIPLSKAAQKIGQIFYTHNLDGLSFYDKRSKQFCVFYNDTMPQERIRFTLAHELGHIALGHLQESDLARKEADTFASYFLAPSPAIGVYKCNSILQICNKFNLSLICAGICWKRYQNWKMLAYKFKSYENELILMLKAG